MVDKESGQVVSDEGDGAVEEVVLPGDEEGSSGLDDGDEDTGEDLVAVEEAGRGEGRSQLSSSEAASAHEKVELTSR